MQNCHFPFGGVNEDLIKKFFIKFSPDFLIPTDLLNFWTKLGGGDFYESETILYPLQDESKQNIAETNEELWELGLSKDYLAFYIGAFGVGTLKKNSSDIYLLNSADFSIVKMLCSFSELIDLITYEFTDRYAGSKIIF